MHVLAIILGLLLLLFGGGCTLIGFAVFMGEPQNFWRDIETILAIWLPFGLLPMVLGVLLFRYGLKADRKRRNAGAVTGSTPAKDDGSHGPD